MILFMVPGKELRGTDFAAWSISVFLRYQCSQSLPCSPSVNLKERLSCICVWVLKYSMEKGKGNKFHHWFFLAGLIPSRHPPTKFLASAIRNWLAGFAHTSFPRHLLLACCWLAVVNLLSLTRVIQKSQNSLAINSMNLVGHIWRISQM